LWRVQLLGHFSARRTSFDLPATKTQLERRGRRADAGRLHARDGEARPGGRGASGRARRLREGEAPSGGRGAFGRARRLREGEAPAEPPSGRARLLREGEAPAEPSFDHHRSPAQPALGTPWWLFCAQRLHFDIISFSHVSQADFSLCDIDINEWGSRWWSCWS
jgi:hypothetical protein